MKRFLPLLTLGLIVLGGCGLEKPPAKIAEEIEAAKNPTEEAAPAAPAAEPAAAPAEELTPELAAGKEIYEASCKMCHDTGNMMKAPSPGDKAAWEPRLANGMEAIMKNTVEGFSSMPARGGNPELTDEQLKSAVDYMVHGVQ
ncbi:MAG: cytochrome c5 family protein [Chlorobiaceae bacterium]|nr:cytochrome c5 family protein [Chlorobiaceae bacterium]